jgi:hypothetical protein
VKLLEVKEESVKISGKIKWEGVLSCPMIASHDNKTFRETCILYIFRCVHNTRSTIYNIYAISAEKYISMCPNLSSFYWNCMYLGWLYIYPTQSGHKYTKYRAWYVWRREFKYTISIYIENSATNMYGYIVSNVFSRLHFPDYFFFTISIYCK